MGDPYLAATHRWWHLSRPSPELLEAEAAGWLGTGTVVADLGCGLGSELGYLARRGWRTVGLDRSAPALKSARRLHATTAFVSADVTRLPLRAGTVDLLLDRGCFHYLASDARSAYAHEARRVLSARGRLLLRLCLLTAGVPNSLDQRVIRATFEQWTVAILYRTELVSDTRTMPALVAVLQPPGSVRPRHRARPPPGPGAG